MRAGDAELIGGARLSAFFSGGGGEDSARVGGWGGIRTLETLARLPVFKTGAFNHSATHPMFRNKDADARIMGMSLELPTILHKAMSRKPDPYGRDSTRPRQHSVEGLVAIAERMWKQGEHRVGGA